MWGTDQTADATDMVSNSTRTRYLAGSTVAVELYMVTGMGHAISGAFYSDQKICCRTRR